MLKLVRLARFFRVFRLVRGLNRWFEVFLPSAGGPGMNENATRGCGLEDPRSNRE
jgi:hypothetical protein